MYLPVNPDRQGGKILIKCLQHGAGCLQKAAGLGIETCVIDRKQAGSFDAFNLALLRYLQSVEVKLVFLVGCIVRIDPIDGIDIYNIHPADPHTHGGNKMYGLEVHRRVISEVADSIKRGKRRKEDRFFTHPTVHEVVYDYDSGQRLVQIDVEIPRSIISEYIAGNISLDEAATRLQKHVLPYEWLILPTAVNIAAKKILDR